MSSCSRVEKKIDWDALEIHEKENSIFCTKSFISLSLVTSLAVALLGILALVGHYYPSGMFAKLGSLLGQEGAYTAIYVGFTVFTVITMGRIYYTKSKEPDSSSHSEHLSTSEDEN
jgi:hypothetical protein